MQPLLFAPLARLAVGIANPVHEYSLGRGSYCILAPISQRPPMCEQDISRRHAGSIKVDIVPLYAGGKISTAIWLTFGRYVRKRPVHTPAVAVKWGPVTPL